MLVIKALLLLFCGGALLGADGLYQRWLHREKKAGTK